MTPYWQDPHLTIYGGDARDVLRELPAESVHCVVTSPPFWGLRDYGVDGQLGLEATPDAYVEAMVGVFREVRRVLRADGTVWLNLGDSYASSPPGNTTKGVSGTSTLHGVNGESGRYRETLDAGHATKRNTVVGGLKPKDLVGIPWRVAFALQADGWYLRSEIIWAKNNPMPESVTDRPTKAHEQVFLLSKSPRYYYDADAVRETYVNGVEAAKPWAANGGVRNVGGRSDGFARGTAPEWEPPAAGRNLRSVWTIATEPYPGAHFATFPRKLVEPCVKAGTSEKGVCPKCGAPWLRVVERTTVRQLANDKVLRGGKNGFTGANNSRPSFSNSHDVPQSPVITTTGWRPSCRHDAEPVPAVVLDIFAGSGTTLLVAQALGRRAIGIDLNPDYLRQCLERNRQMPLGMGAA
jgi:DNA modification methylase